MLVRYLGIDYGQKRIGLSYADELRLAIPLKAAVQASLELRLQYIGELIKTYKIQALVVGYPYHLDGTAGKATEAVDAFIGLLKDQFQLPVYTVDERLTSYQAQQLKKSPKGLKQKLAYRKTGNLDSQAATLILQDFLDEAKHSA